MSKPNTFIVGAPKCGTTAISHYLSLHPEVFMCTPKEPHHFVYEAFPNKTRYPEEQDYLRLFIESRSEDLVVAEASVWYLYCFDSIKKIHEFNPDASLIIMLRRPDEMIYSMHSQAVVTLQENIENFEQAWLLGLKKERRVDLSVHCKEPALLKYGEIAAFASQLSNVYQFFPKSKVHIIFYEDFVCDAAKVYSNLLEFLALPPFSLSDYKVINPNIKLRSKIFGSFLKKPPARLMSVVSFTKRLLNIEKIELRSFLTRINQKSAVRQPLSDELRFAIINHYRNEITALARMTQRNLDHWLQ